MSYYGVILVGGRGSRLGKLTNNVPKPLIKIRDKPFLDYLLYQICKYKFKKIYLLCSYKYNQFKKSYHNKYIFGVHIICINEKQRKGTAGALFYIKKKIKNNFFLFNGDSYFPINLDNFYKFSLKQNKIITIACKINENYNSNKKISNLGIEKNLLFFSNKKTKIMNGGIYFIKKKFLNHISNKNSSLENDHLKSLIIKKEVAGKLYNKFFVDIGLKKNLKLANQKINKYFNQKAFFLDRDGVINKDIGYLYKIKDLVFLKDTFKAIKYLNHKKYLVIIVTNQSGIGRGYYNLKQFRKLEKFIEKTAEKNKCKIDSTYFCPHHPKFGQGIYKKKCNCRKPKPGLILNAINNWSINVKKSFMIGDNKTDQEAAQKAAIKFYFKTNNSLFDEVKKITKA